jgi:hypothetical protein
MKRTSRKPSNLSESLHQRLNSYALAASAAGVSLIVVLLGAALGYRAYLQHANARANAPVFQIFTLTVP